MTTANASCPLGISRATIAAWRDGALSGDEAARIAAHVSGCDACRHEIAVYESLDNALRRQPVPQSDGRLWRAVRAGMTSAHRPRNTRRTVRRVAGATSALAAVLLLALGFAQLFQARGNVTYHPGVHGDRSSRHANAAPHGWTRLARGSRRVAQLAAGQFPHQRDHLRRTI